MAVMLKRRKKHPPKSVRYCVVCETNTSFEYDPGILHSRCMSCGASSLGSKKPKNFFKCVECHLEWGSGGEKAEHSYIQHMRDKHRKGGEL